MDQINASELRPWVLKVPWIVRPLGFLMLPLVVLSVAFSPDVWHEVRCVAREHIDECRRMMRGVRQDGSSGAD